MIVTPMTHIAKIVPTFRHFGHKDRSENVNSCRELDFVTGAKLGPLGKSQMQKTPTVKQKPYNLSALSIISIFQRFTRFLKYVQTK